MAFSFCINFGNFNSLISWIWTSSRSFASLDLMRARFSFFVIWRIFCLLAVFLCSRFLRSSATVFFLNLRSLVMWPFRASWALFCRPSASGTLARSAMDWDSPSAWQNMDPSAIFPAILNFGKVRRKYIFRAFRPHIRKLWPYMAMILDSRARISNSGMKWGNLGSSNGGSG